MGSLVVALAAAAEKDEAEEEGSCGLAFEAWAVAETVTEGMM